MQRRAGDGPVFSRSKNHQITAGGQRDRRQPPLRALTSVVGKKIPTEVNRSSIRIVKLDPVGKLAILVRVGRGAGRQKLADDRGRRSGSSAKQKHGAEQR